MRRFDSVRWLVVVFGSWLMLGNARGAGGGAVGGVGYEGMAGAGKTAVPWSAVGAEAGKQYTNEGLSVTAAPGSARLLCVFQRLEGMAMADGLWLTSTVTNAPADRFRVCASALGRVPELREAGEAAGGSDYAAVSIALKRFALKLQRDPSALARRHQIERLLNVETFSLRCGHPQANEWNEGTLNAGSR